MTAFFCPECGSREARQGIMIDLLFDATDPWSGVLQRYQCARCNMVIPAHLAERWNGISSEQAVKEWRRDYRSTAPKSIDS